VIGFGFDVNFSVRRNDAGGDSQANAGDAFDPKFYYQFIVVAGGGEVFDAGFDDGKDDVLVLEFEDWMAEGAHEFAARGFKDVEVARVVDVVAQRALRVDDTLVVAEDFARHGSACAWAQKDRFFVGPFHFHAVGFDSRIVFERVVDDAAIEGVQRLQFDNVAPAADFFGGVFGFAHKSFAGLAAVVAHIDGDLRQAGVFAEKEAIGDVLKFAQGLSLAADQTAGIVRLNFEHASAAVVVIVFDDGGLEAEVIEQFFEDLFGISRHRDQDLRFCGAAGVGLAGVPGAAGSSFPEVSFICRIDSRF
jgi:hypothetical protein